MSDSPRSEPPDDDLDAELAAAAPREPSSDEQAEGSRPRGPRAGGGMGDIEEGIAHLFASFERGVMSIAQAEGDKRRAAAATQGDAADQPASPKAAEPKTPRAPRRGMTYDEVFAPRSTRSRRSKSQTPDDALDVTGTSETEPGPSGSDTTVTARPGRTYDDVLKPIRWRNILGGLVLAIVLFALYIGATFLQVWTSADDDETQAVDAIIVLGAAQFDGTPSPVLAARLDHALELYEERLGRFIITTGSNREGDRFTEGFSGFVYLREAGVPEEAILTIVDGADTYQQMTASLAQIQERDLGTAMLVSDSYHSHRLRSIADEIGLEAYVSPTAIEPTNDDYLRETAAVSIGRLLGYRRLSAWNTTDDAEG